MESLTALSEVGELIAGSIDYMLVSEITDLYLDGFEVVGT